jgi:hypothetical protein
MNANINSLVTKGLTMVFMDYTVSVIRQLAEKYGFDAEVEIGSFQENFSLTFNKNNKQKEKVFRIKWKLPFNNEIYPNRCHAVSKANLLFNQCDRFQVEGSDLCKSCLNHLNKQSELPYGRIETRVEMGDNFKIKNQSPIPYFQYMKKYNITREEVIQHATERNIVLREEHFIERELPKKGRGRKPKSQVCVETVNYSTDEDDDAGSNVLLSLIDEIIVDTAKSQVEKKQKKDKKKPQPEPEPELQPESEYEEPESVPFPEPVPEPVPEPKKEAKKSKTSKKTVLEPVPEPVPEPKKEDKKSKTSKKTVLEPVPEPVPKPAPKPTFRKIRDNGVNYYLEVSTLNVFDMDKNHVGVQDPKGFITLFEEDSDEDDDDDEPIEDLNDN